MNSFSSKLPIWHQLSHQLRIEILSGNLKPGERIDSEIRMAERYGISVIPVRQALRALEEEGLIVRQRGSGTYVSRSFRVPARSATSLEALYTRKFPKPAEIFERGTISTPPQFLESFRNVPELAFVRRLAYRDGVPWSYGTLYYRMEFDAGITTKLLRHYPLYRLLQERCGVQLARSHFDASAITMTAEIAKFLQVDPLSPGLALSCVTFDGTDSAIGAFQMTFRGAPFVFSFDTPHKDA